MKTRITLTALSLAAIFLLLYAANLGKERRFEWLPTYDLSDRQPFGAYVFDRLLAASWPEDYTPSRQGIREQLTSGELTNRHLLSIAHHVSFEDDDLDLLLEYIAEGHKVLIAADLFDDNLQQAMNFKVKAHPGRSGAFYDFMIFTNRDLLKKKRQIALCSPTFRGKRYTYPSLFCENYFDSIPSNARIIAVNDSNRAIAFTCPEGKGEYIVCCTPLFFTNYGLLSYSHEFVWGLLSYLQGAPLMRVDAGDDAGSESRSPFRYLLSEPALKWALMLAAATIAVFFVFTARRKQRVIRLTGEQENKLLQFVHSLAALYLKKNSNPDILQKKYHLFAEQMQREYGIDLINKPHNRALQEAIVRKTGADAGDVQFLFEGLELIHSDFPLTDRVLMELIILMDKILKTPYK
ncbi:MAG: hypothetical protein LBC40_02240 [Dysgonamonadaceae bacterium]|jgi:hypothetical protein|nr:hypothetical protein [Dysgonamonadaceae bacterium]